MEPLRLIELNGPVYRVVIVARTPDRDCMAEVAKLFGAQLTPEIMEVQGYDWQTSNRCGVARICGVHPDSGHSGGGSYSDVVTTD